MVWKRVGMFDVDVRDEVEGFLIRLPEADGRITAAAVVGSRAHTQGDRWSDIDLTFAVVLASKASSSAAGGSVRPVGRSPSSVE